MELTILVISFIHPELMSPISVILFIHPGSVLTTSVISIIHLLEFPESLLMVPAYYLSTSLMPILAPPGPW